MLARVRVENGQLRLLDPLQLEEGRIYTLKEVETTESEEDAVVAALKDILVPRNPDLVLEEPEMTEEELWEELTKLNSGGNLGSQYVIEDREDRFSAATSSIRALSSNVTGTK